MYFRFSLLAHRILCARLLFSRYSHEEENEEYASINLIINKRILQFFNQKKTSLAGFYLYFCAYFYA